MKDSILDSATHQLSSQAMRFRIMAGEEEEKWKWEDPIGWSKFKPDLHKDLRN